MHVESVEAQFLIIGLVLKFGECSRCSGVMPSLPLDLGSKLSGPSPVALFGELGFLRHSADSPYIRPSLGLGASGMCLGWKLLGVPKIGGERKNENNSQLKKSDVNIHSLIQWFQETNVALVVSGQGIESWLVCHEFEPSTTKDPPCTLKDRCTLNLLRAQTSSCWCGVLNRRGSTSSGVILIP
ncbi:hypothetical protein TNCV_568841 [Trichonephila clavipes]|nr:hypothetical protein TNCV_568841 [Trichonephila clavipes]